MRARFWCVWVLHKAVGMPLVNELFLTLYHRQGDGVAGLPWRM